jgi:hypothetical protein
MRGIAKQKNHKRKDKTLTRRREGAKEISKGGLSDRQNKKYFISRLAGSRPYGFFFSLRLRVFASKIIIFIAISAEEPYFFMHGDSG